MAARGSIRSRIRRRARIPVRLFRREFSGVNNDGFRAKIKRRRLIAARPIAVKSAPVRFYLLRRRQARVGTDDNSVILAQSRRRETRLHRFHAKLIRRRKRSACYEFLVFLVKIADVRIFREYPRLPNRPIPVPERFTCGACFIVNRPSFSRKKSNARATASRKPLHQRPNAKYFLQ